jgi:ankyrin repeat protein
VKELVRLGANVQLKDKLNTTAVMSAANKGHTETVEELIRLGAILEAKSNEQEKGGLEANSNTLVKVDLEAKGNTHVEVDSKVTNNAPVNADEAKSKPPAPPAHGAKTNKDSCMLQ